MVLRKIISRAHVSELKFTKMVIVDLASFRIRSIILLIFHLPSHFVIVYYSEISA